MPTTSLAMEVGLSSQHVSRVIAALKGSTVVGWEGRTMFNIYWITSSWSLPHVKKGHLALKVSHISAFPCIKMNLRFLGSSMSDFVSTC